MGSPFILYGIYIDLQYQYKQVSFPVHPGSLEFPESIFQSILKK